MSDSTFLKSLENNAHSFFSWISGAGFAFYKAAINSVEASGGQVLKDAATSAVTAAEAAGGTGNEKFTAAFNAVEAELKTAGVAVVVNAINIAIESAVAAL